MKKRLSKTQLIAKTLSSTLTQCRSISRLSQDLNTRLKPLTSTSLVLTGMRPLTNTSTVRTSTSTAPFSEIIDKLEEITEKTKVFHIENPLKDLDPKDFELNKKAKVFFEVETLNRVSPLIVTIKKTGKILTFVSSKHPLPDKYNNEKVFSSSKIVLSDKNYRFKVRKLFFSVVALENVEISIEVEFKKIEVLATERKLSSRQMTERKIEQIKNNFELRLEFTNHVAKILANRKKEALEKAGFKDFVKINKVYKTPEERKVVIRCRSEEKLKREKSVAERKEINYQQKIQKAKNALLTNQILKTQRQARELQIKQQQEHNTAVKHWLSLLYFIQSLLSLEKKFTVLKTNKAKSLNSALKIQKIYRRWNTHVFESVSKEMLHTRNILLLYNTHTSPHAKFFKKNIITCINFSVSAQKPQIVFEDFFNKLVTIQSYIKEYLAIREQLLNKSIKMWMIQTSKIVKKLLNSNPDNRFLHQVIRIKDSKRYSVLKEFLREKCRYRKITYKTIRAFLPTKNELLQLIKLASLDP